MLDANAKQYIIDASFAISFLLPDEKTDQVTIVFNKFLHNEISFISNYLLHFEVLNSLKIAVARKRLSKKLALELSKVFLDYKIHLKPLDFYQSLLLAHQHNLTFYDASYLYLSKSQNLPLLTLDKHLIPFSLPLIKFGKLSLN